MKRRADEGCWASWISVNIEGGQWLDYATSGPVPVPAPSAGYLGPESHSRRSKWPLQLLLMRWLMG
jgi:hypothetical protein